MFIHSFQKKQITEYGIGNSKEDKTEKPQIKTNNLKNPIQIDN